MTWTLKSGSSLVRARTLYWVREPGDKAGHWIEQDCKTEKSRRELPLFGPVLEVLTRHMAKREAESWKGKWLFVSPAHAPLHGGNLSRAWHEALTRAGVRLRSLS